MFNEFSKSSSFENIERFDRSETCSLKKLAASHKSPKTIEELDRPILNSKGS